MAHVLLLLLGALVVGAAAYGVTWVITGRDRGLDPEEPDGRGVPLPSSRPLVERDVQTVRFDTTLRGYRMDQVDAAIRRSAYDIGYKEELIGVLEAELTALRAGDIEEADALRDARLGAGSSSGGGAKTGAAGSGSAAAGPESVASGAPRIDDGDADLADETGVRETAVDQTKAASGTGSASDDDLTSDEPVIRPGATDASADSVNVTHAPAVSGR